MRVDFLLPGSYGYENGKVEISHVSLPDISRSELSGFLSFACFMWEDDSMISHSERGIKSLIIHITCSSPKAPVKQEALNFRNPP